MKRNGLAWNDLSSNEGGRETLTIMQHDKFKTGMKGLSEEDPSSTKELRTLTKSSCVH